MPTYPATVPNGTAPLPKKIAVLVLDDQRFDRHKIDRLCADLPMRCKLTQADSIAAFNTHLDNAAFDLILVDYSLPDGSGLDALELIKLSPRNCSAASIMITGYAEDSIALDAMSRGCADYITKDELSASSFERAVTNALQKSVLSTQVQAQTFARAEVERVLQRFASQSAADIKPMVSRMIRQLRDLRDAPSQDTDMILQRRESVETSCLHLWDFLEELEKHHAGVMMKDLVGDASFVGASSHVSQQQIAHAAQRKRPPSPFSRTRH